jgi:phytoene dehydrogenase-like protein
MRPARNKAGRPAVAVIGTGLAGLSATYHLRDRALVTIFEREACIGGRVCSSQGPPGELGAEFFLSPTKEPTINKLIEELGLHMVNRGRNWPGYLFRGKFASGGPLKAVEALLTPTSAKRVKCLFKLACNLAEDETSVNPREMLDRWLSQFLKNDREAIAFVTMLLAGETCAPSGHITARYGLECLSSLYDDWYSIRCGSQKLVDALYEHSGAQLVPNAHVRTVEEVRGGVRVNWTEGHSRRSETFQAAIVATPDGERLVGAPVRGHFHSYVSILLEYKDPPRLMISPDFDLRLGLYTDGRLNYIQATKGKGGYVLRILFSIAEKMLRLDQQEVIAFCIQQLGRFMAGARQVSRSSVRKWEFGLPCGGAGEGRGFRRMSRMDAAIASGQRCAAAIQVELLKN